LQVNSAVPKYIFVEEDRHYSKAVNYRFLMFLTLPQAILSILILLCCMGALFIIINTNRILFIISESIIGLITLLVVIMFFAFIPNSFYKKASENKAPVSIKIFEDRVEETTLLPTGDEISYIYNFGEFAFKEEKDYLFIKGKHKKAITGCLLDKKLISEDAINYIKDNAKLNKK